MAELINLVEYRSHSSGWARCALCYHRFVAIIPIGVTGFECPNCHYNHAHFEGSLAREEMHWTCTCGCQAFSVTQGGIYCNFCGEWQHGCEDGLV